MEKTNFDNLNFILERTYNIIDFNKYCRDLGYVPAWAPKFMDIDVLYGTTTENISEYYKYFKKPESVLTVCGSGDHVLNALSMGASDIACFDVNLLAYFALELKLAAIKTLSYGEYFVFYDKFPLNLFEKIIPNIPEPARTYWDHVLTYAKENIGIDLFAYETLPKEMAKRVNMFGDKKIYSSLKEQASIAKFDFFHSDIYDVKDAISDRKFDIINFSNVYEYTNSDARLVFKNAMRYHEYILWLAHDNLNENGQILVSYFYNYNSKVRDYVARMIKYHPNLMYKGGALTPLNAEAFRSGFTMQKVAYNHLLDLFDGDVDFRLVNAVGNFGESFDKSNDAAIIYIKK